MSCGGDLNSSYDVGELVLSAWSFKSIRGVDSLRYPLAYLLRVSCNTLLTVVGSYIAGLETGATVRH